MTELMNCDLNELKNSLSYEKESIISKTIFKDELHTIVGYAFDRGKSVFPKIESVNLAIHVLEGKAEVMVAGKNYDLEEGQKIFMPKDEFHALFAKTKLKLALVKGLVVNEI